MAESVQNKARRLVVGWQNRQVTDEPRLPIELKDIRIISWRNVVTDNIWKVVCWTTDPKPTTFYIVEHNKDTGETTIQVFAESVIKVLEKGRVRT